MNPVDRLLDVALLWRAYLHEALGPEAAEDYLAPAKERLAELVRQRAEHAQQQQAGFQRSWPSPKGNLPAVSEAAATEEKTAPSSEDN
jgi:hypothetical protein